MPKKKLVQLLGGPHDGARAMLPMPIKLPNCSSTVMVRFGKYFYSFDGKSAKYAGAATNEQMRKICGSRKK